MLDHQKKNIYTMTCLLVLVFILFLAKEGEGSFQCKQCLCNQDGKFLRAICSGQQIDSIPDFGNVLNHRIFLMGLARNEVQEVSSSDLGRFPHLKILDLRQQTSGCVKLPQQLPPDLKIYGRLNFCNCIF